ncbi:MAG: Hpt domain-containing protein [Geminicoccales bacterium]
MSTELIDKAALTRLLTLIGDDPDDLDELIDDYLEAAPNLARAILDAAEGGDIDAMRIAAHTLKSNARDLGATRVSEQAGAIETACKNGDVEAATVLASEIEAEAVAANEALSRLKDEGFGRA